MFQKCRTAFPGRHGARPKERRPGKAVLLALIALAPFMASAAETSYFWKQNDVLRFEYSKSIRTIEETNLDEVYSERPVTLIQSAEKKSLQLVVYEKRTFQPVDKTWQLGSPKVMAACAPGDKLTPTGQMDEDEHHFRWIEVRNEAGVTGYLPGTTKVEDTREFAFDAILILEIKSRTEKGTLGVLHFDAPHLVLPDEYLWMPNVDDPVAQKDKTKAVIHALEGAVKLARWNVILDGTGVVHIDSRIPKGLDDWLKETEHIAFWRGKFRKFWMEIVEKNLGLVSSGDERNLFVALTPPPASAGTDLDKIRPYRSDAEVVSNKGGKIEFRIERKSPPNAGKPFALPFIGPPSEPKMPGVFMLLKPGVKGPVTPAHPQGQPQQLGVAWFDLRLGVVDSVVEGYSFDTEYSSDEDARRHYKIAQKVSVNYSLKRLAPPITPRADSESESQFLPAK